MLSRLPSALSCALAFSLLAGCGPDAAPPPAPDQAAAPAETSPAEPVLAPAGDYRVDPAHTTLLFRVSHLGFSHYTARFDDVDARLKFDPAAPGNSSVTATIKTASLQLPSPPPGFEAEIEGPDWLDAARYPEITFRSTRVEPTGPRSARITGDLTLHGVTRPVVLEASFNGGYAGHTLEPQARIGFSAHGTFNRSDFGIAYGVPAPGTNLGVSDAVEVIVETELNGPPWKGANASPAG